ncbi:MAG: tetratricopeptide repeat protein [Candidatus Humimicrobiaceae bacterium]
MKMEKIFEWFIKKFYTFWGLLLGYLLIIIILIIPINSIFSDFIENKYIILSTYIFILIIFTVVWFYLRSKLPTNKEKKIGILIAIETESIKQKNRITKDVTQGIEELLSRENLLSLFNIIIPNDYQTKKIIYYLKSSDINKNKGKKESINKTNEMIKWDKISKKINAHLYIIGEVIERFDVENKYIIKFKTTLIKHRPIDIKTSNKFSQEIELLLPKEFAFFEKLELKGFKITTDLLYIAIKYLVGVAAFLSADIKTSHLLHKELNDQLKILTPYNPFLKVILINLKKWRGAELQLLSKYEYFVNKDESKTLKLINEAENILPNNYDILVFKAYLAFDIERNSSKALHILDKAKKCARDNYAWLYNRAFLLMYDGDYKKGFKEYENLENINFVGDDRLVEECINYDKSIFEKEPNKKQCLFMIAYLYLKKVINICLALDYFELFVNQANNTEYEFLLNKSKEYISLIKKEIGLKE